jgi:hypothetical protein
MLLCDVFRNRIISKNIWPPQLPDYYLQGAMKGAVYKDSPHTLLEPKEVITDFIRTVSPIELSCVLANKMRCLLSIF